MTDVVITGAATSTGDDPLDFTGLVPARALRRLDRTMKLALHTVLRACRDAEPGDVPPERIGVVTGTGFAGSESALAYLKTEWEHGPELANPALFPNTVPNAVTGQLAIHLKARGPSTNFFEAGTAGENAIRFARNVITDGDADVMVVCGIDERSEPFQALGAVYERACRIRGGPAFERRESSVAGALVLESGDRARARQAKILAVLHPVVLGGDTSPPGTRPTQNGSSVIEAALRAAGIALSEVDRPGQLSTEDLDAGGVVRAALALDRLRTDSVRHVLLTSSSRGGTCGAFVLGGI